jgi:transposase-like protein
MGLINFLLGDDIVNAFAGDQEDSSTEPTCSHCGSTNLTATTDGKNVQRYHCQHCFSSTSDTAGTVWHKTHLSPEKRQAIEEAHKQGLSIRKAAEEIGVNKNTVNLAYQKLDGLK